MERRQTTSLVFCLIVAAGLIFAMVKLAGLVQAAQIPHH